MKSLFACLLCFVGVAGFAFADEVEIEVSTVAELMAAPAKIAALPAAEPRPVFLRRSVSPPCLMTIWWSSSEMSPQPKAVQNSISSQRKETAISITV